jgi:hypothetical protein
MTTVVTIKTGYRPAWVHTAQNSEGENLRSYVNTSEKVAPNSERTVSIYGTDRLSVNEDQDFVPELKVVDNATNDA